MKTPPQDIFTVYEYLPVNQPDDWGVKVVGEFKTEAEAEAALLENIESRFYRKTA